MEIDYKIKSFKLTQNGISADIRIYKGATTTENEKDTANPDSDVLVPVTRYRRDEMVKEVTLELDAQQVANLFRKYVNKKMVKEASDRGATIISEQQSTKI